MPFYDPGPRTIAIAWSMYMLYVYVVILRAVRHVAIGLWVVRAVWSVPNKIRILPIAVQSRDSLRVTRQEGGMITAQLGAIGYVSKVGKLNNS